MKLNPMTAVVLMAAAELVPVARASDAGRPVVAVCVDTMADQYDENVASQAEVQASRVFRRIGVQLDWHRASSGDCGKSGRSVIRVTYSLHTPTDVAPSALACALPYEGVHIEAFYDRIPGKNEAERAEVLGYVLVHEIAHILQGVARHSESGIMKAAWDKADFVHMRLVPLSFTEQDVELIHDGIKARANHGAPGTFLAAADSVRNTAVSSTIEESFQQR